MIFHQTVTDLCKTQPSRWKQDSHNKYYCILWILYRHLILQLPL